MINPGFEVALNDSSQVRRNELTENKSLAVVAVMQQGGPVGWMLVGRQLMAHTLRR